MPAKQSQCGGIPREFIRREAFDAYLRRRHEHCRQCPARLSIRLDYPARADGRVAVDLISGVFSGGGGRRRRSGWTVRLLDEVLTEEAAERLNSILRATRRLSGLDHVEALACLTQHYLLASDYCNYAWGNYFSLLTLPPPEEIRAEGRKFRREWEAWLKAPAFSLELLFRAWPDMSVSISSKTAWERGPDGRPIAISWQSIPPVRYRPDEEHRKRGLKVPVMVDFHLLPAVEILPRAIEVLKPLVDKSATGMDPRKGSPSAPRFPVPPGTRWERIRIRIVSDDSLCISANGGRPARFTFSEIGFKDKRRGDLPDGSWEFLKELARRRGEMASWPARTTRAVQKRIQSLRGRLKALTGMEENPFHPYRKRRGYVTKFRLDRGFQAPKIITNSS